MAIHFTRTTPTISDLTIHMPLAQQAGPEQTEIRQTFLPAEWHPQSGIQLTWPHAATDWEPYLREVDDTYIHIALEILAQNELLLIVTPEPERIKALVHQRIPTRFTPQIRYFRCSTDDTWARDHAFITTLTTAGPRLIDFRFNGWGLKFPSANDNMICRRLAATTPQQDNPPSAPDDANTQGQQPTGCIRGHIVEALDFVLEGGSIESDGCGTILTTEACLLSPNRNPHLDRNAIEARLRKELFAERILWLHHGRLIGDDTDSHIDTLARFCSPTTIAYVAPPADTSDPQYDDLAAMEQELRQLTTTTGKPYELIPLPCPTPVFDPDDGHRLPATYANFLILNNAILMPTYGQPETDELAHRQLAKAFPRRAIIDIDSRTLVRQHGSIHCSTMQYPTGVIA